MDAGGLRPIAPPRPVRHDTPDTPGKVDKPDRPQSTGSAGAAERALRDDEGDTPSRGRRAGARDFRGGVTDALDGAREVGRSGRRDRRGSNFLDRARDTGRPVVIAHRGNTERGDAPNSIASLERAKRDGSSDAVEMDIVELGGDGTLVVYHEGDDPTIGEGDLETMTRRDLEDHPQIPTLREWSRRAGELDVNVMAEFKGSGYERRALRQIRRHVEPERLAAMSFDPDAVRAVHQIAPRIPVALVLDRGDDAASADQQVDDLGFRPDYVEVAEEGVTSEVLDAMERRGIGVLAGEDRSVPLRRHLHDPRIQGVLTDVPTNARLLRDHLAMPVVPILTGFGVDRAVVPVDAPRAK